MVRGITSQQALRAGHMVLMMGEGLTPRRSILRARAKCCPSWSRIAPRKPSFGVDKSYSRGHSHKKANFIQTIGSSA